MKDSFILKGGIAFSEDINHITCYEQGFLVCIDGKVREVLDASGPLPDRYRNLEVLDYSRQLIIPGLTDLHTHAPQYTYRGIGLDLELLDWLEVHTFPEEARYADAEYAAQAYEYFVEDLRRCFTTRAIVFATIHNKGTEILMDQLDRSGVITYVGRVNMDRNASPELQDESATASVQSTTEWLDSVYGKYSRTYPIVSPRLVPCCSNELLSGLGALAQERNLRTQAHLSENLSEVAWVRELVPKATCYGNVYEKYGVMGTPERPAVMAHCVHSDSVEMQILKKHGTYIAHCPDSNMNLTSGIAPVRIFLDMGINVGLGTDVAGTRIYRRK